MGDGERTRRAAERLERGEPLLPADFVNGFERAARSVFPGLNATWDAAQRLCGRQFFLSGAGPALFALASNRRDALDQVARLGQSAYAVRTVKHARAMARVAPPGGIGYP